MAKGPGKRGSKASAISDRSGVRYPMNEMVIEPGTGWLVHKSESDGKYSLTNHPLNNVGRYLKGKLGDPYPVQNARPDINWSSFITWSVATSNGGSCNVVAHTEKGLTLDSSCTASATTNAVVTAFYKVTSICTGTCTISLPTNIVWSITTLVTGTTTLNLTPKRQLNIVSNLTARCSTTSSIQIDSTWVPSSLTPTIWYDAEDATMFTYDTSTLTSNYLAVSSVTNKTNPGTYNAVQSTSSLRPILEADSLNQNMAIFNRTSGNMGTSYFPKAGTFSLGLTFKVPTSITSTRAFFGCNDSASHAFYLQINPTGTLTFGIGNTTKTTTATYSANDVLYIVATSNGSQLNLWVNGTQVLTNEAYSFSGTSTVDMKLLARTSGTTISAQASSGAIGQFVLVEREITATERSSLQTYLQQKTTNNKVYHVLFVIGDRAATGNDPSANYSTTELPNMRIRQLAGGSGTYKNMVIPAIEPLQHTSMTSNAVGLGYAAAKQYLASLSDTNSCVLIVPMGKASSGFGRGDWTVTTGTQYIETINKSVVALGKASTSQIAWMLVAMGADDASYTQSAYATALDSMITGFRTDISGATSMKVTLNGLVPSSTATGVIAALQDTPNRDSLADYVSTTSSTAFDTVSFTAGSSRTLGQNHYTAFNT